MTTVCLLMAMNKMNPNCLMAATFQQQLLSASVDWSRAIVNARLRRSSPEEQILCETLLTIDETVTRSWLLDMSSCSWMHGRDCDATRL